MREFLFCLCIALIQFALIQRSEVEVGEVWGWHAVAFFITVMTLSLCSLSLDSEYSGVPKGPLSSFRIYAVFGVLAGAAVGLIM